jgi:hypothetical protein
MQRAQLEMVSAQTVRSCAEKRRCISLNLLWPDGYIRSGGDSFTDKRCHCLVAKCGTDVCEGAALGGSISQAEALN